MDLRDIEAILPPGFRFYPSDEELVCHYLYKRVLNERPTKGTMIDIDLHICEPWQLPDVAKLGSNEWYFFSFRDRKYATGSRTNRATTYGYWKATGKDRPVFNSSTNAIVGMRKTLVFYRERAPHGIKTSWVMHEFRLENPHTTLNPKDDWVLCRVFQKSKGESTSLSLQNEHSDIGYSSNPESIDQSMRERQEQFTTLFSSVPHQRHNNSSSTSLDVPLSHYNFLDETPTIGMNYNSEDGCGYLLDIGTEDENLGHGGPPDLEDMRFQGVNKCFFKFGQ